MAFRTSREIWVMPVPDTQYTVMYETYPSLCWKEATESVVANVRREKNFFGKCRGVQKWRKFFIFFSRRSAALFSRARSVPPQKRGQPASINESWFLSKFANDLESAYIHFLFSHLRIWQIASLLISSAVQLQNGERQRGKARCGFLHLPIPLIRVPANLLSGSLFLSFGGRVWAGLREKELGG